MIRLVYILAASHSGSTLLAMLLGSHPEICTAGELKATSLGDPDRYRCSCRELVKQCPFWQKVRAGMARRGLEFDITNAGTHLETGSTAYVRRLLRPLHRGPLLERVRDGALALSPAWRRTLPQIQARNAALAATLLELTGAKMVVDSSKVGLRLKYLLRNPELDVKVIRLIRDGRAVAATYMRPGELADASDPALRGGGNGQHHAERGRPIEIAAREWRRSNEEAEQICRRLPRDRWTLIRYEDLCRDPTGVMRGLGAFLGVSGEFDIGDFRSRMRHVIGNGMRMDETSEIRLDERWRTSLSEEQVRAFDGLAGRLNCSHGFES